MEAAFKPQVFGELDTQNFMKFDEVRHYDLGILLFFFVTIDAVGISFSLILSYVEVHFSCWNSEIIVINCANRLNNQNQLDLDLDPSER